MGARILLLGGSAEGFEIADLLVARGRNVMSSFAGRTTERREPAGLSRVGGFGGVDGLERHLTDERVVVVVDALHPFAARMKANVAAACAAQNVPLIRLSRPVWTAQPGDDWRPAIDLAEAARIAPVTEGVCFLTIGRQDIAPFAARTDLTLLIRVIDAPDEPFDHPRATFLHERGPFDLVSERVLFDERRIGCLVTKNSGAAASEAKLAVARERGLPVVMVERPKPPDGHAVVGVEAVVDAVEAALEGLLAPLVQHGRREDARWRRR